MELDFTPNLIVRNKIRREGGLVEAVPYPSI